MPTKRVFKIIRGLALIVSLFLMIPTSAYSSSYLGFGRLKEQNPVDGKDIGNGQCLLFLGPYGDFLADNEYLLLLGDEDVEDGFDAEVFGDFEIDRNGRIRSFPDDEAVRGFFQQFVEEQVGDPDLDVEIQKVNVKVKRKLRRGDEVIRCRVRIKVGLFDGDDLVDTVLVKYRGTGLNFAGFQGEFQDENASSQPKSTLALAQEESSCPFPNLTPDTQFCEPRTCLLDFAGFQWWTNYQFDRHNGYYYNGGLRTVFSPRNAFVDSEGLHLRIKKDNVGGGLEWTGSEVVAVRNADGTPASLGFGTYLVNLKLKSAASWNELDRNVAVGLFTYQKDKSGDDKNPYRELDLAEISRWGHVAGTACNNVDPRLCEGNSQFALQLWNAKSENLHRYTIDGSVSEITLVMVWSGANQPVTFRQYNGGFNLDNLPANPDNEFTTSADQNPFVPDSECERFHMNFWLGNFGESKNGKNPGPSNNQDQEVVITNFQYRPVN